MGLCLLLATAIAAADLPPHMVPTWGGWLECEKGYLMRGNACVSEADVQAEKFVVSNLPSAGDGAFSGRSLDGDRRARRAGKRLESDLAESGRQIEGPSSTIVVMSHERVLTKV